MVKNQKNPEEVDWTRYFNQIQGVCPWSLGAWQTQSIDIVKWSKEIKTLNPYRARVYTFKHITPRRLKKICGQLNEKYQDEFLWSHPRYLNMSTPVPVIIQQDRLELAKIRLKQQRKK